MKKLKIKLVYIFIFFINIGCNSKYNENEYNIIINYTLLNRHKVALSPNNDTIYVYDNILKNLEEMDKYPQKQNKTNVIRLKIYLKTNQFDNIINYYNDKNLTLNNSFTEEIIMGIALDKTNNKEESLVHYNKAKNIVKILFDKEIQQFYIYFINFLMTKDFKKYVKNLTILETNKNYSEYKILDFIKSFDNIGYDYDFFLKKINDNYDSVFLPIE